MIIRYLLDLQLIYNNHCNTVYHLLPPLLLFVFIFILQRQRGQHCFFNIHFYRHSEWKECYQLLLQSSRISSLLLCELKSSKQMAHDLFLSSLTLQWEALKPMVVKYFSLRCLFSCFQSSLDMWQMPRRMPRQASEMNQRIRVSIKRASSPSSFLLKSAYSSFKLCCFETLKVYYHLSHLSRQKAHKFWS